MPEPRLTDLADTDDPRTRSSPAGPEAPGWSTWQATGGPVGSGDANQVPAEIKADVETLARTLVTDSARFEDLFPPEDLGLPPGDTPLDNEVPRFSAAIDSLDQEELMPTFQRLEAWARENCMG